MSRFVMSMRKIVIRHLSRVSPLAGTNSAIRVLVRRFQSLVRRALETSVTRRRGRGTPAVPQAALTVGPINGRYQPRPSYSTIDEMRIVRLSIAT